MRILFVLVILLLLTGCECIPAMETLGQIQLQPADAQTMQISVDIADDALVIHSETGTIYICDGYEISLETFSGGNISETMQQLTGVNPDSLTVIQTSVSDFVRYETGWCCFGDEGQRLIRILVMDDGLHHYCVSLSCQQDLASAQERIWSEIMQSLSLS